RFVSSSVRWSAADLVPDGDGGYRPSRRLRVVWYLLGAGFCVFLVEAAVDAASGDRPVALRVLLLAVLAAYATCYVGLSLWALGRSASVRGGVIVLMLGLYLAAVAGLGSRYLPVVTFALVVVAILTPWPWSMPLCGAVVAGVLGLGVALGDPLPALTIWVLVIVALGSALVAGATRLHLAVVEARAEISRLAVAHERERVYRDLHDVLGYHLTAITVKAALTRRLLESGATGRALSEAGDVERLGREALAEVRATVANQRATPLAVEVATAAETLRAARIKAELPADVGVVEPRLRGPFGHVVREGITNVIRHSGAGHCWIRCGPTWVEVGDDGADAQAYAGPGSGLTGLSRRLEAVGGGVTAGPEPTGGFRLRAECPARGGPGS
ncbi:MAG: histidine kinase, partial [Pseudonocardia sp.]|nr:histidine kinase [Pseudonocardia sp.]